MIAAITPGDSYYSQKQRNKVLGSLVAVCVCACMCLLQTWGQRRQWGYNTSVKIFEILKKVSKLSSHSLGFRLLPKHVEVPAPIA